MYAYAYMYACMYAHTLIRDLNEGLHTAKLQTEIPGNIYKKAKYNI